MFPFEKNSEKIIDLLLNTENTGVSLSLFEKFEIDDRTNTVILFTMVVKTFNQLTFRLNKNVINGVHELQKILLIEDTEKAKNIYYKLSNNNKDITEDTYLEYLKNLEKNKLEDYFNYFYDFENSDPLEQPKKLENNITKLKNIFMSFFI